MFGLSCATAGVTTIIARAVATAILTVLFIHRLRTFGSGRQTTASGDATETGGTESSESGQVRIKFSFMPHTAR
jgi:hypothetical protein